MNDPNQAQHRPCRCAHSRWAEGIMKKQTHTILGQLVYLLTSLMLLAFIPSAHAESFLWDAISTNDIGKAKTLIAFGADVNQKNRYGNPIIHHAMSVGNPEIVELLISKGADVNAKGQFDRVALHYANKKGMAKILLAHGAIVDAPTNYGETPLHWAAEGVNGLGKQVDLVEFADALIAHGADVNKKTGKGRSYQTPLNYAAYWNNLYVAKLLITHGADVEGGGSSPLSSAGVNGDFVEMAQLLVESGANVNARNSTGSTPLHPACRRGNKKVVEYLLSKGADANAKDVKGTTPLYAAAGFGGRSGFDNSAIMSALLAHGADVNAKDKNGLTALHQAASHGSPSLVEILLAHHADVNATSQKTGTTPLHMAVQFGKNIQNMELLIKHGALVNLKTVKSDTPLKMAVFNNDKEKVLLLLNNGAAVNGVTDRTGRPETTPLSIARSYKYKEIEDILLSHGAR